MILIIEIYALFSLKKVRKFKKGQKFSKKVQILKCENRPKCRKSESTRMF